MATEKAKKLIEQVIGESDGPVGQPVKDMYNSFRGSGWYIIGPHWNGQLLLIYSAPYHTLSQALRQGEKYRGSNGTLIVGNLEGEKYGPITIVGAVLDYNGRVTKKAGLV